MEVRSPVLAGVRMLTPMKRLCFFVLLVQSVLTHAQSNCAVLSVQQLATDYLEFGVDTVVFQTDGSFEIQLSNGSVHSLVPGCTNPDYAEYDPGANADDGSCATPLFNECGDLVAYNGHNYETVEIGGQCWFAENLRTVAYSDGSLIASGLDDGGWTTTMAGATTVNGEGNSSCNTFSPDFDACDVDASLMAYGRLYNWYAVEDARGLCPSGWHVPTDGEWTELEDYVASEGSTGAEATALKSVSGWTGGGNGTDVHGFSALPGGVRFYVDGSFPNAGANGYWWSSTSAAADLAWRRRFMSSTPAIDKLNSSKRNGFSVRCLQN